MKRGAKIALLFMWGMVGAALILYVGFINDKPKIEQENQNYLTMNQAESGLKSFINSSSKIVSNSHIKLP